MRKSNLFSIVFVVLISVFIRLIRLGFGASTFGGSENFPTESEPGRQVMFDGELKKALKDEFDTGANFSIDLLVQHMEEDFS